MVVYNCTKIHLETDVFDSCIFPREHVQSTSRIHKILVATRLMGTHLELKQPNRRNELSDCLKSHLESEFNFIENCTLTNKETLESVYQKIKSVFSQCRVAKKVDITQPNQESAYFIQSPQLVNE